MIFDEGDDALVRDFIQQCFVRTIRFAPPRFVLLAPGTRNRVDVETKMLFVFTPALATVNAPQTCCWCIGQLSQDFLALPDLGFALLNDAIGSRQESIGGL